jgi:hypothetical protein
VKVIIVSFSGKCGLPAKILVTERMYCVEKKCGLFIAKKYAIWSYKKSINFLMDL